MSSKLLWTGLTFIVAMPLLFSGVPWAIVGAVLMVIGMVLMWLDK